MICALLTTVCVAMGALLTTVAAATENPHGSQLNLALFNSEDVKQQGPYGRPYGEEGKPVIIGGHNITVGRYLWSSMTGTFYELTWPQSNATVLAKQYYLWWWKKDIEQEIANLKLLNQFVLFDEYNDHPWILSARPPGVTLTQTMAFRRAFNESRRACDELVETIYEPVFNEIIRYIATYGLLHATLDNKRVLFSQDAKEVHLVEFVEDREVDPSMSEDFDLRNFVAWNIYNTWPNDGIRYADWCVNGQDQEYPN